MDEHVIKRIKEAIESESVGGTENVVSVFTCMGVLNSRKHPGVDLKFVFCIMGKLDVNQRHIHRGGDPLRRVVKSVRVTKDEKMVRHSVLGLSYPFFPPAAQYFLN